VSYPESEEKPAYEQKGFGVSKSNQDEQIIYLCEGKKELKRRSFGKVVGEAIELQEYADYVYVFGSTESFEKEDLEDQISKCERLGIGKFTTAQT